MFVNKLVDILLDGRGIRSESLRTNLFRKMNEEFLSVIRAGAGLKKGTNGEKCEQNFEDMRPGSFWWEDFTWRAITLDRVCLYEIVGDKCEEEFERRGVWRSLCELESNVIKHSFIRY